MIFIPRGYITLCDAVSSVMSMYGEMDADVTFEGVVFSFGTTLSAGEFTSVGLDLTTGISRSIPVEFWRMLPAHSALVERRLHAVQFEKSGPLVPVIPLIEYSAVKARFDHKNEDVSVLDENLFDFDERGWDLLSGTNKVQEGEKKPIKKGKGGRPDGYPWGDFWMEAALFIARKPLPTHGGLSEIYDHMNQWMTDSWSEIPDTRTFDRKFEEFGKRWDENIKMSKSDKK